MSCFIWGLGLFALVSQFNSCANIGNVTPQEQVEKNAMDTVPYTKLGKADNKTIVISKDVDLCGSVCIIPPEVTLHCQGGVIKNGIIIGQNTKIKQRGPVFNKVTIKGTWIVPSISTEMFVDLDYDNALKDVVALSNSNIHNRIIVDVGKYYVSVGKDAETCILLGSNTEFVLNGDIILAPNKYKSYYIIQAKGDNIYISGKGSIIGDKHTHTGNEGEWGMGVFLRGANYSSIKDITIKDCWGDCVYIGGNSKNVLIDNCIIDNGRRQGISIVKADSVTIRNCKISNVSGTNPQYEILLEPNPNCIVDHVAIENVEVKDCIGGIASTRLKNEQSRRIGLVQIRNCNVSGLKKNPLRMTGCESVFIENCIVNATNSHSAIYTNKSQHVIVKDNTINVTKRLYSTIRNAAFKAVGKTGFKPIEIIEPKSQEIKNNRIVEK